MKAIALLLLVILVVPFFVAFADYTLSSTTGTTAIATWGSTGERTAITFTTVGAGTISSVEWCGRLGSGTPTGVAVSIWDDSSGSPGSVIGTSDTRGGFSGTAQRMTYTFSTPVNVSAGTTYWVGFNLASLTGGAVQNCGDGGAAGTQTDKYSTDSGSSWSANQTWEQNYSFTITESSPPASTPQPQLRINNGRILINSGSLHLR